jgi:phosphopantetheinyl transferase (holo-ACP synthase)
MIGNDIVDLALAKKESNWKRNGFLNKIFSEREQVLILSAPCSETMVWNLWSRKEAAYKIFNRETGLRKYNPIAFECYDIGLSIGKVKINDQVFYTKTQITTDYIYTVAVLDLKYFDKIQEVSNKNYIHKVNGIPFHQNRTNVVKPLSKTHHGRYERIIM